VQKERKTKHWNQIPALLVGAGLAFWITLAVPTETPEALWFVFVSGAIAICAMILPGISGSFVLLILGKYAFIMQAFKNLDLVTLTVFALGCLTGLLSFVRVVSFFFKKYHDFTVVLLTGFMLGSLPKIWPWRIPTLIVETAKGPKIIQESAVLPKEYAITTQQNPEFTLAVLGLAIGVLLVVMLDFAPKPKTRE
jgi:putative membrane protein